MTRASDRWNGVKGAAALGEVAGELAKGAAGLPGAAAGFVGLVGEAWAMLQEANRAKVQALLEEAYFANGPDETAMAHFRGLLQDPKYRRVLVETVRAKLEALADEVTPALAMLMRDYERTGRPPDWFFRAFCRVLQDLSADEFVELRELVARLKRALQNDSWAGWLEIVMRPGKAEVEVVIPLEGGSPNSHSTLTHIAVGPCAPRILQLMGANGLGAFVGAHEEPRKSELAGQDRFFRRRVSVASFVSSASRLR
jgi:hypothetical protein